ncbi:methyltransferase family protein [Patescibacteria group bacterium]
MSNLKLIISSILKVASLFLLVFWGAGRLDYWQGWVFSATMLLTGLVVYILFRSNPDLFKERLKPGPGMKWWDKVFWVFNALFYLGAMVVGILGGGRELWPEFIPLWGYIVSYVGYVIGAFIIFWAMWTNKFFSSVVRIQKDRDQKVITGGPYKYVRHPGYVGASILMMAIGPILGSLWAMIPSGLWVLSIIIRTYLEDKTLQKELDGYKEYTKKTKYRLIPGIWTF